MEADDLFYVFAAAVAVGVGVEAGVAPVGATGQRQVQLTGRFSVEARLDHRSVPAHGRRLAWSAAALAPLVPFAIVGCWLTTIVLSC